VLHAAEAGDELIELQVETTQSHIRVALAARTRLLLGGEPTSTDRRVVTEPGFVAHALTLNLEQARPATVEKVVALYTSRDRATSESRLDARLEAEDAAGFDELLARHEGAWASLWNRFDMQLDSANEWTETVLHLHIFHLLQTVSPHAIKLDVGVPARGWHGEAYRGHVFWDELLVFPFLNFQRPAPASARPSRRRGRPATAARCSPGKAAATDGRRPSGCTSTRARDAGCPTTPTCSATSTSRSPTTSGSTT
jgi:alpha,alpha-trehalase